MLRTNSNRNIEGPEWQTDPESQSRVISRTSDLPSAGQLLASDPGAGHPEDPPERMMRTTVNMMVGAAVGAVACAALGPAAALYPCALAGGLLGCVYSCLRGDEAGSDPQ